MRRFFALLAILTGLATVATPASAAAVNDVCQQVTSGQSSGSVQTINRACLAERGNRNWKNVERADCKHFKAIAIHVPAVQMGIDRAHE
ncbi:hypothetical protein [Pontixanthobacter sp.]|uniref:hypothetical protein n=1 Tax=Pontixanthobacter sp. TaxID=2792078 RepID=UPI003C7E545E